MSAEEIIKELPKLSAKELRLVKERLQELENGSNPEPQTAWGKALDELVGKADDLPADLSVQHDHYLYGVAKQ